MTQVFKGIPQQGNVLGKASAPVTMVEYVDLQCPVCRAFETEVMPTIIDRYVRTGKVKVEARTIAFIGPDSDRGRRAAIAASRQNRLFDFEQLLYANQGPENGGWLDDSMVTAAAKSIPGLDVQTLLDTRNSASVVGYGQALRRPGQGRRSRRHPGALHRQERRQARCFLPGQRPGRGRALGGARPRPALSRDLTPI